ncbi:ABC transporter I family member 11, chloroplastic isoform X2 [Lactuca sativa]|uniref:ABC transporter I family member 11, chloroplastic isoform X2 n=1 Tax=Lactuca sativa TaxID=4236 RepID=UPI000CD8977A|nr:ABC transporter I family member 11, chloroplastic isoform X2 [Lactuca sativa]
MLLSSLECFGALNSWGSLSKNVKVTKNQTFHVSCNHSCFEFWLDFWAKWKWKNYSFTGLTKPTSGSIYIQRYTENGTPNQPPVLLSPEKVGIVFQFPERYFVADNVFDEITFGLPRQKTDIKTKQLIATRLEKAITSVGLNGISLDKNPNSLSGGYKRRLALAIQLVHTPELLVLDEPLAGLDWKARADVVKLLMDLKKELTILVVSHDLKELAPLVDRSWRMNVGGVLMEESLPI